MLPIVMLYKRSNQDYPRQTNGLYVYLLSRWKPGISLTLPLQIPFISHLIIPRNEKSLLYLLSNCVSRMEARFKYHIVSKIYKCFRRPCISKLGLFFVSFHISLFHFIACIYICMLGHAVQWEQLGVWNLKNHCSNPYYHSV